VTIKFINYYRKRERQRETETERERQSQLKLAGSLDAEIDEILDVAIPSFPQLRYHLMAALLGIILGRCPSYA